MNHFEAVEKMRQFAAERNLKEVNIEIDWNATESENGYNVSGVFKSGESQVDMFWDTAFQDMTISGPFGSETINL